MPRRKNSGTLLDLHNRLLADAKAERWESGLAGQDAITPGHETFYQVSREFTTPAKAEGLTLLHSLSGPDNDSEEGTTYTEIVQASDGIAIVSLSCGAYCDENFDASLHVEYIYADEERQLTLAAERFESQIEKVSRHLFDESVLPHATVLLTKKLIEAKDKTSIKMLQELLAAS